MPARGTWPPPRPHGQERDAACTVPEDGDQGARDDRRAGPRGRRGLLSRGGGAGGPVAFPVAGPVPRTSLACDGKEVRGAVRSDGTSLFLLSAASGGIVLADREIPAKTNEIPEIGPMLMELNERFPLAGWVLRPMPCTPSAASPPWPARISWPTTS